MAHTLIWARKAEADLQSIAEYTAAGSARYATVVTSCLWRAALRLEAFPHSGGMVPEFRDPALRQLVIYRYRLIYRVRETEVHVLAVMHGARDIEDELRKRLEE